MPPSAPEHSAICYFDEKISYAELNDQAYSFASLLASWSVKKGDRVAILHPE